MKTCLIAALSLALLACAATTEKIEPARLNQVQQGRTTVAEVLRAFGIPSVLSKNPDGAQAAMYVHGDGKSTTIVPLVAAVPRDSVTFYFDSRGLLSDVRTTQASAGNAAAALVNSSGPSDANRTTQVSPGRPAPASPGKPASAGAIKTPEGYINTFSIPGWLPDAGTRNR